MPASRTLSAIDSTSGRRGLGSVRAKLSLLLLSGTILVSSAVGVLALTTARNLFVEQARTELFAYNQALAGEIDAASENSAQGLRLLAHDPALERYFNATPESDAAKTALGEINSRLAYISATYTVDEVCLIGRNGAEVARAIAGLPAGVNELSPDESGQPFVQAGMALESDSVYRSPLPYRSEDTHSLAVAQAVPIDLPGGKRVAVLHFETSLAWFAGRMRKFTPDRGDTFLIAGDGSILVPPQSSVGQNPETAVSTDTKLVPANASYPGTVSLQQLTTQMLKSRIGRGRYFDGRAEHDVAYRPVFNGQWLLATSLPTKQVLAPFSRLLRTTIFSAVPVVILTLLALLAYTTRLLRPVRHLTLAMQALAKGDLSPEVRVARRDELGDMACAFNAMAEFQRRMANTAAEIAAGNLSISFTPASVHDTLGKALVSMIAGLTQTLANVQRAEARFRSLVQNVRDIIFILDREGRILYVNPAYETITDRSLGDAKEVTLAELVHEDDRLRLQQALTDAMISGTPVKTELRIASRVVGEWCTCELLVEDRLQEPAVGGIVATCHDITERHNYENKLSHQALHDSLTMLANRALFQDRMQLAIARRQRRNAVVGVVLIDLDNFKVINDSLGHLCGDVMLLEAADRVKSCVRASDTVARLDGDEFAILLDDCGSVESGIEVVERILAHMRDPTEFDGRELFLSCSIGVAFASGLEDLADELLAKADLAMNKAKSKGKNQYVLFDGHLGQAALQRLELESALRYAIARNELEVHYQPIVNLDSEQTCEVEALVRWNHPERGVISPVVFVPIAEETGLILPIGQWVLEQACRDVQAWNSRFCWQPPLIVNVNLSTKQFQNPTLIEDVKATLQQTELPPACLKLEITESMMMYDTQVTVGILWKLKELGIRLAIDDFGTGYSSL